MNRLHLTFGTAALIALLSSPSRADHINAPHVDDVRAKVTGEGYLSFQHPNFLQGTASQKQQGDEYTGWVDARAPWRDGTLDATAGYDTSDHYVSVRTNILTDSGVAGAGGRPPEAGQANIPLDFDTANRIYVQQAGLSVLWAGSRNISSGTGGAADPAFTFPLNAADRLNIVTAYSQPAANPGNPPLIETYYGRMPNGTYGVTRTPGANPQPGIFIDNSRQNGATLGDTFGHELFHFLSSGSAGATAQGGDPGHSSDPRNVVASGNIQWSPGQPAMSLQGGTQPPWNIDNTLDVSGPPMTTNANGSPRVGGVDQIDDSQRRLIFDNTRAAFPYVRDAGDHADQYADYFDGNYVADTRIIEQTNLRYPGDNHTGADYMYWEIGGLAVPVDNAAFDHDQPWGVYDADAFRGTTFSGVDVASIIARYADSDVTSLPNGGRSREQAAEDYDLWFSATGEDGSWMPGVASAIFDKGWNDATTFDDYVVRWMSPIDNARYVRIGGTSFGVHDGNAQIDGIIAFTVPEPGTMTLGLLAVGALMLRLRRTSARRV